MKAKRLTPKAIEREITSTEKKIVKLEEKERELARLRTRLNLLQELRRLWKFQ